MADTKQKQEKNVHQENPQDEQTQASQASGIPDYKTDRDEIRHSSELFFRSLFKAGVHLALAPVYVLPEESREHFFTAGREFTRGLSTLAQEIADDFDKLVSREKQEITDDFDKLASREKEVMGNE